MSQSHKKIDKVPFIIFGVIKKQTCERSLKHYLLAGEIIAIDNMHHVVISPIIPVHPSYTKTVICNLPYHDVADSHNDIFLERLKCLLSTHTKRTTCGMIEIPRTLIQYNSR